MKKSHVLLGIGLVAGAVVTGFIGNYAGLTKDSWPGWVQAIGSIAALGVAIFVMSRQNAHSARLLAESDNRVMTRRASAVSALLVRANEQLIEATKNLKEAARDGDQTKFHVTWIVIIPVLRQCRSALEMVPAHELGAFKMVSGLHSMIEALDYFLVLGEDWETIPSPLHDPMFQIQFCESHRNSGAKALSVFNQGVDEITG
ncbi:hypothetical protein [Janthinobacterium sp. 78]|uniref:hypothetical protein n=1 Tax=Janthinobacterium sp. 78 TaxID=2135631 RepID=UPI00105777E7|nr:hypothetical protein [Janthinobacterium sp. 78]